jgi:hypothetical protein
VKAGDHDPQPSSGSPGDRGVVGELRRLAARVPAPPAARACICGAHSRPDAVCSSGGSVVPRRDQSRGNSDSGSITAPPLAPARSSTWPGAGAARNLIATRHGHTPPSAIKKRRTGCLSQYRTASTRTAGDRGDHRPDQRAGEDLAGHRWLAKHYRRVVIAFRGVRRSCSFRVRSTRFRSARPNSRRGCARG